MSPKRLMISKLRNNPKNVRFEQLLTLLDRLGFTYRQKGSHASFSHPHVKDIVTIPHPHGTPHVRPHYIKELLRILDEAGLVDDSSGESDN